MQGAFYLTVGVGAACQRLRVVCAVNGFHIALGIMIHTHTFDDVCTFQTHLLVRRQTEEFFRRILLKVAAFNPQLFAKRHGVLSAFRVFRIIGHEEGLLGISRIIVDYQLHGVNNRAHTGGYAIQVIAHCMFKQLNVVQSLIFGVADASHEILYAVGRKSATTQSADGRHARVIPTGHKTLLDKLQQFALAHNRIGQVQAVEFYLTRTVTVIGKELHKVFVERAVRNKLQRTDAVRNALEIVALSVGKVVHWVNMPFIARAPVRGMDYAVDNRVAEVHIVACHVYFGTQHIFAFLKLTLVHALEQVEVLLYRSVAIRTFDAGSCGSAFLSGYLFAGLLIHISIAAFYHTYGQVIKLLEIVGSVIQAVFPVISKPVNIAFYGFHIFVILLLRVRVVEAQIAGSSEAFGCSEVHDEGFSMTYVKITVRLGRKACVEAAAVLAGFQIFLYFLLYEVEVLRCVFCGYTGGCCLFCHLFAFFKMQN